MEVFMIIYECYLFIICLKIGNNEWESFEMVFV